MMSRYVKINLPADSEALDIPSVRELRGDEYEGYISQLFFIDHHDVLRSCHGDYPIAVTKEQYEALIAYLRKEMWRFEEDGVRPE